MLYLRNVNQVQSIDNAIKRGGKGVEATINWLNLNSGSNANLFITNNGVPTYAPISVNTTSSGSLPVFPNAFVTATMTGSAWSVDGPTIMTLITTGSGLNFTTSSYISSSVLTNGFVATEGQSFDVTGSVSFVTASYVPGPCMEVFYRLGNFAWVYDYNQCDGTPIARVSGSGTITGTFGPIDWNSADVGGDATNKQQLFVAPYTSSFRSAAIGNGTTVTFTNPNTDLLTLNTTYLASWIPLNSSTYSYQLIPAVRVGETPNTLTVCTRFPEQAFLSPGSPVGPSPQGSQAYATRLYRLYITSGSSCTI